jgi:hypothetical protein
MNLKKLLKRNLALPISERVSIADIEERVSIAKFRGDAAAMIADIDNTPQMAFKRQWDAFINSGSSTFADFLKLIESEIAAPVSMRPALPSNVPMPPNICLAPRINL